jgi:hypothetical protein
MAQNLTRRERDVFDALDRLHAAEQRRDEFIERVFYFSDADLAACDAAAAEFDRGFAVASEDLSALFRRPDETADRPARDATADGVAIRSAHYEARRREQLSAEDRAAEEAARAARLGVAAA